MPLASNTGGGISMYRKPLIEKTARDNSPQAVFSMVLRGSVRGIRLVHRRTQQRKPQRPRPSG